MSTRINLSVIESDTDIRQELDEIVAAHPEFNITIVDDTKSTSNAAQQIINDRENYLTRRIHQIFTSIGIPLRIKGYQYLCEAIKVAVSRPDVINAMTKELYPAVAKTFQTTPSKVERAIRHAIEVSWARGRIESINNFFGVRVYDRNDRPTNSELIGLLSDKLLIDAACEGEIERNAY